MPRSFWPRGSADSRVENGSPAATSGSAGTKTGPQPTPSRHSKHRVSSSVVAVAFAAGLLFATNASLFSAGDQRHPRNLVELARTETERLEQQETSNARLRAEIESLLAAQPAGSNRATESRRIAHSIGLDAVEGPGLEVQLWDAPEPVNALSSGFHPDDLVVHQQDLEAVINALWAGGAEAMTIQGQRITSTSGVRCVGNVLLLHGRTYSPPYVVRAIGDPEQLKRSVSESPGVQIYQQYVDAVGLGWSTAQLEEIEMPAYTGSMSLQHAEVLDEDAQSGPTVVEPFSRDGDEA